MLKFPQPGKVKTRLIPALGEKRACLLYQQLVRATLRQVRLCKAISCGAVTAFVADAPSEAAVRTWLGDGLRVRGQSEGNLGQRMCNAFAAAFSEQAQPLVMIGGDCPELTSDHISRAIEALQNKDLVLGPAADGGYYLIGLRRLFPQLFQGIDWGTERVLKQTVTIASETGLNCELLETLHDLDLPEDLSYWARTKEAQETGLDKISVIMPCLNEAFMLEHALRAAQTGDVHELIVVDGGSQDQSREIARQADSIVLESPRGRGRQMNCGAAIATGQYLLFVHADTVLPLNYQSWVRALLNEPGVAAGAFSFAIREPFTGRGWVERATNWRARTLQLPYGDQGLFLKREVFERCQGFKEMPLMEDYDLICRLRKIGRISISPICATTSGRRWRERGWIRTTLTNTAIILGHHAGISPLRLARWYGRQHNRRTVNGDQQGPSNNSTNSNRKVSGN